MSSVRKQIYLTRMQNEKLKRAAARQGRSEAEILREALDRFLEPRSTKFVGRDSLKEIIGAGASDDDALSEKVDDVVYGRYKR